MGEKLANIKDRLRSLKRFGTTTKLNLINLKMADIPEGFEQESENVYVKKNRYGQATEIITVRADGTRARYERLHQYNKKTDTRNNRLEDTVYDNQGNPEQSTYIPFTAGNKYPTGTKRIVRHKTGIVHEQEIKNEGQKYSVTLPSGEVVRTDSPEVARQLLRKGEKPRAGKQKEISYTYKDEVYPLGRRSGEGIGGKFEAATYKRDVRKAALQRQQTASDRGAIEVAAQEKAQSTYDLLMGKRASANKKDVQEAIEQAGYSKDLPVDVVNKAIWIFGNNPSSISAEITGAGGKTYKVKNPDPQKRPEGTLGPSRISVADPKAPPTVSFKEYKKQMEREREPIRAAVLQPVRAGSEWLTTQSASLGGFRVFTDVGAGAVGAAVGLVDMVAHPVKTVKGLAYSVSHPMETGAAFGEHLSSAGLPYVTGEFATYYFTGKVAGKVAKKVLPHVSTKAKAFSRIEKDLANVQSQKVVSTGKFKLRHSSVSARSQTRMSQYKVSEKSLVQPKSKVLVGQVKTAATKTQVWISKNRIVQRVTDRADQNAVVKLTYERGSGQVVMQKFYKTLTRSGRSIDVSVGKAKVYDLPGKASIKELHVGSSTTKKVDLYKSKSVIDRAATSEQHYGMTTSQEKMFAEFRSVTRNYARLKTKFRVIDRKPVHTMKTGKTSIQVTKRKVSPTKLETGKPILKADKIHYDKFGNKVYVKKQVAQPRTKVTVGTKQDIVIKTRSGPRPGKAPRPKHIVDAESSYFKSISKKIDTKIAQDAAFDKAHIKDVSAKAAKLKKISKAAKATAKKKKPSEVHKGGLVHKSKSTQTGEQVVFVDDVQPVVVSRAGAAKDFADVNLATSIRGVSKVETKNLFFFPTGGAEAIPASPQIIKHNPVQGLIPISDADSVPDQRIGIDSFTIPKGEQRVDSNQQPKADVFFDSMQRSNSIQRTSSPQIQRAFQDTMTEQQQVPEIEVITETTAAGSMSGASASSPFFDMPPPFVPVGPSLTGFKRPKSAGSNIFDVQVRRRGKFRTITSTGDLKEAVGAARKEVEETAAASFRILSRGSAASETMEGLGLPTDIYRRSKREKNVFVQRREKRISSLGEKFEISFKGAKSKKKKKGKSKGIFGGGFKWAL